MNVVILAGGASSRMGRDKADLPWQGTTVLGHLIALVRSADCRPLVVGRSDAPGADAIADSEADQGPLGGLVTALDHLRMDCLLLACDLPLLDLPALQWLIDHRDRAALHGLAVECGGQLEPCFGLYRPAVVELARERLASGKRSLHGLIEAGRFTTEDLPFEHHAALRNVNTPAEWAALGGAS
ncbi:MAG: molybdenum cofactor guanylyltransferase [Planctomycetota bacterium]|jgi:molybdopterin-guanine dinucleotide biosynthesis protein A|nr:molybdenum cofactor guanylyltransferase [Planctomycetota bacterium]